MECSNHLSLHENILTIALIIQLLQCSLVSSFTCRWYTSPTHPPHNHPTPIPYQPYTHPTSRTSEVKLVYAGILTSNFFVIQIIVKSRHHIDLQSIQTAPWNVTVSHFWPWLFNRNILQCGSPSPLPPLSIWICMTNKIKRKKDSN